jgi:hypothetical protein
MSDIKITERDRVNTALGPALQLKVFTVDYRLLSWREVCDAFNAAYPGRWGVQVFPPSEFIVDGKCVYHIWLLDSEPAGMNIKSN